MSKDGAERERVCPWGIMEGGPRDWVPRCKGHYPVTGNMVLPPLWSCALGAMLIRKLMAECQYPWGGVLVSMENGAQREKQQRSSWKLRGPWGWRVGLGKGWEEQSPNSRSWSSKCSPLGRKWPVPDSLDLGPAKVWESHTFQLRCFCDERDIRPFWLK